MTLPSGSITPSAPLSTIWTARAKIVFVIAYIVAIFLADNFFGLAAVTLFLLVAIFLSRVPLGRVLRSVKMILFLVIFTAGSQPVLLYGRERVRAAPAVGGSFRSRGNPSSIRAISELRLFLLVLGTSLLTLTTTPVSLTDGIESLLKPLTSSRCRCTNSRSS